MSRQFDAKQDALRAYPSNREYAVDLFLSYLDISYNDFIDCEGITPEEYIFGNDEECAQENIKLKEAE